MENSTIAWIFVGLVLLYLFGAPSSINIPGFGWDLNKGGEPITNQVVEEIPTPLSQDIEKKELKIVSMEPRQSIYELQDIAYVDIAIKNTLEVEYNLTVEWFFENKRYKGWFNKSTEIYDVKTKDNVFWSNSMPLNQQGEWEVQALVKYQINNQTKSTGLKKSFKVI